ncbi:hypothetical protein EYF80_016530 [Liparis tanakae]|uniref:Uncharacterized protein n=1 Tax=Liparis tanakae TaxID=230148 RepID=A0A4Z2I562_9TELE|nr:hypothetical protein EYF80_016530 [Liparis tanakae]
MRPVSPLRKSHVFVPDVGSESSETVCLPFKRYSALVNWEKVQLGSVLTHKWVILTRYDPGADTAVSLKLHGSLTQGLRVNSRHYKGLLSSCDRTLRSERVYLSAIRRDGSAPLGVDAPGVQEMDAKAQTSGSVLG